MATILVGHVTKDGGLAGPRVLEHVVDTVLAFEGDRHHALRLLRAVKHRFGSTQELGLFEMGDAGLVRRARRQRAVPRRPPPSASPGSVVVPTIEGHRPLLVELQALVARILAAGAPPVGQGPRRRAAGACCWRCSSGGPVSARWPGRTSTRSRWAGCGSSSPAPTSALALAIVSALTDQPLPADLVACGEIGLAGELRQVGQTARRLVEAARLGFTQAVVPHSAPEPPAGIDVIRASTLVEAIGALSLLGPPSVPRRARAAVMCGPATERRSPTGGVPRAGRLASVAPRRSPALLHALASVAPGQPLREGIDRILQAGMGGLIVIGDGPDVLNICSGGFLLDAAFSPQRLSELAKMDGATILAGDASRIARANVHLVPNPSVPTSETGTRHRTAERVARSINVPVIAISQRMATIAVYVGDDKHEIEPVVRTVNRANQALQTLERYKARLDAESTTLSALEVEDMVTMRDVVTVLQRAEMVGRIAEEIEGYIIELGDDGRLVRLQLEELHRRHRPRSPARRPGLPQRGLGERPLEETLDALAGARAPKSCSTWRTWPRRSAFRRGPELDVGVTPRGYRLLSRIPRLPEPIIDKIVDRFGNLQKIMRATIDDLDDVEGVGETRARAIKDGLARLAETSILDRYA